MSRARQGGAAGWGQGGVDHQNAACPQDIQSQTTFPLEAEILFRVSAEREEGPQVGGRASCTVVRPSRGGG